MRNTILTKLALIVAITCASHTVMAAKKVRKFYVLPVYTSKSAVVDKKVDDGFNSFSPLDHTTSSLA